MDSGLDLSVNAQSLLETLAATGRVVRLARLAGGLDDLASQWARHVEGAEERLFPRLVARGPAEDGPVGFCLAEHAALPARLTDLAAEGSMPEWLREAEMLVGRPIQHVFLERPILQPLLDWTGSGYSLKETDCRVEGRKES